MPRQRSHAKKPEKRTASPRNGSFSSAHATFGNPRKTESADEARLKLLACFRGRHRSDVAATRVASRISKLCGWGAREAVSISGIAAQIARRSNVGVCFHGKRPFHGRSTAFVAWQIERT